MQGRQQICILCRNISRPARIIPTSRRTASQLRSLEPYDASKLILDLDAADSKYVRRYEDQEEEKTTKTPTSTRGANAVAEARKQLDPKAIPDLYRPNAVDFIRYALVDDAWKFSAHKNAFLRKVLSKCLLPGLGKFKDHIEWLRAYEILPYKVEQLLHVPDEQVLQGIELAFRDCKTLGEFRRITALMTNTVEGCKFVSSNGTLILHAIAPQIPGTQRKSRGILKYINAVIQKLETKGVDPGPQWYGAALYSAAITSSYPALKRHIDIAISRNDKVGKIDMKHVRAILDTVLSWPFDNKGRRRLRYIDKEDSRKGDFLRLLTGWDNLGVPEGDEDRKPCLALLLQGDRTMYEAYIQNLAKLEAYEAIWYEFNHIDLTPIPGWATKGDEFALFERANIFARTFIHSRVPLQALKLLQKHGQMRSSGKDWISSTEEPKLSSSEAHSKSIIEDQASSSNKDQIPSNERHPPSSTVDNTSVTSILSIPGLSQNQQLELREALANKYQMTEVYDVNKGNLFKDLKELDLYTPKAMSDIVGVLSAYWIEAQDKKIRKWLHDHGPNNPVIRMAAVGMNHRLKTIGEEWERRNDISEWYIPEDVQRLKRLQADLQSLKLWTEADDDLLKMMVNKSWPEGADDCKPEDWKDLARKMADSVGLVGIQERYSMVNFLKERYKSLMRKADAAGGAATTGETAKTSYSESRG
jgi:hypothetical protein